MGAGSEPLVRQLETKPPLKPKLIHFFGTTILVPFLCLIVIVFGSSFHKTTFRSVSAVLSSNSPPPTPVYGSTSTFFRVFLLILKVRVQTLVKSVNRFCTKSLAR